MVVLLYMTIVFLTFIDLFFAMICYHRRNAFWVGILVVFARLVQSDKYTMSDKYTTCFVKLTPELNLHQAQLNDPDIAIVVALEEQRLPLFVWKKNEILRTLWYCWDELFLSDGLLARDISTGQKVPRRVFVVPHSVVGQILHSLHSEPSWGHMGITRTLYCIKQRFLWPKMQGFLLLAATK